MTGSSNKSFDQLGPLIDRLRTVASEDPSPAILSDLDAAEHRLAGATFRLVVVGEFKRGKSTLINALLGKPILPTGVTLLTSIITEVMFGERPETSVEFSGGPARSIALRDLEQYVTEIHNPGNVKHVRRVRACDNAPILREGVSIVDTPGIGSVFLHNSELTYGYLQEADAIVMVLGADQPVTAEEQRLLRALGDVSDRILFVVNRVDVLRTQDVEPAMRFIREQLAVSGFPEPERVLPMSALDALEARLEGNPPSPAFAAFENVLRRDLIDRKSEILFDRALALALRSVELLDRRIRQNLGAIRYDWMTRLDDAVRRFDAASREQLDQLTSTLEEALEQGRRHRATAEADRTRTFGVLDSRLKELHEVGDELRTIRSRAEKRRACLAMTSAAVRDRRIAGPSRCSRRRARCDPPAQSAS